MPQWSHQKADLQIKFRRLYHNQTESHVLKRFQGDVLNKMRINLTRSLINHQTNLEVGAKPTTPAYTAAERPLNPPNSKIQA